MIIEDLKIMNMDSFYSIIKKQLDNPQYKNSHFGRNYSQLMNHISVIMELSNVTDYEYVFLKMYCTSVSERFLNKDESMIDKEFLKSAYPEIYNSTVTPFLPFLYELEEKYGKVYWRKFLPTGFITSRVVVTLSGSALIACITSLDPTSFFIQATNGECSSDNTEQLEFKDSYDLNSDTFNNYIIATFINKFYKFIIDRCTYVDILSDANIYSKFLDISDSDVYFMSITSPFFVIDLAHENASEMTERQKEHIEKLLKVDMNDPKSRNFLMNNTYFEIALSTGFAEFIKLFELLPYEKFTSIESFVFPSEATTDSIPDCPQELLKEYKTRYSGRMTALSQSILSEYSKNSDAVIKKLELTQPYSNIRYTIKISLNDIDSYLIPFTGVTSFNEFEADLVDVSVFHICNKIINFTKSIYTYLR